MKKNDIDSALLERLGHRSGMTVPEGYFENFAKQMSDTLPVQPWEKAQGEGKILPAPSLWQKVRTYAYMAAMFAGVWLMMWVFGDIVNRATPQMTDNPVIASVLGTDGLYDFYDTSIDEYELMEEMCEEGLVLTDFKLN
ncbi:MAG: hypothetical protein NC343_05510 [Muribaculum sp.]|nr:hypothetical protein [Muribaculaceae bacterium]MCM1081188.1 hypothetical protein [Muribaculum sp.]